MQLQADVVIAGAGPAGSTTALLLARAGIDVLLLDRAHFPRAKPCGDCLSADAARVLDHLGLLQPVLACAPARLAGWRVHAGNRARFTTRFAELGDPDPRVHQALALPRRILDSLLLDAARRAGARVITGAAVTDLLRDGDTVTGLRGRLSDHEFTSRSRLVVGADGLRSRMARRLHAIARPPRTSKLSLTAHCPAPAPPEPLGQLHLAPGLCLGLAPVSASGDVINLTLVAHADRFAADVARDSRAFFTAALGRFPQAGLAAAIRLPPAALLASGPFDVPMRRITFDGAVLVGDAAGYFDPFTGQGVHHALLGAEQLAAAIVRAFSRPGSRQIAARALASYAAAHHALTAGPRRVQRLIDLVLARPALAERAIRALERTPRAACAIVAVTAGLQPARTLLSPTLALQLLDRSSAQRPPVADGTPDH